MVLQRPEIKTSSSQHNLTVIKVGSFQRVMEMIIQDIFQTSEKWGNLLIMLLIFFFMGAYFLPSE